jgi:hypothetical protein
MSDSKELGKEFLEHHGVIGMHWGTRKANLDRVVNAYKNAPKKALSLVTGTTKGTPHPDHIEVKAITKKHISTLSTSEIRKANDRINTENQYKKLRPSTVNNGKKIAAGILAATTFATGVYKFSTSKAGQKSIGIGRSLVKSLAQKMATTTIDYVI